MTVNMNDVWEVTPCSLAPCNHGRGKRRASGATTPSPTGTWANDVTGLIGSMVLVSFHAEVLL
jgi:hypothetical protein